MAIDTINKKLSLIYMRQPSQPSMPISSDGLEEADKRQLLWEYSWGDVLFVLAKVLSITFSDYVSQTITIKEGD